MTDKPIIFRPFMADAIWQGIKTKTRRLDTHWRVGDRLWVRENLLQTGNGVFYQGTPAARIPSPPQSAWNWSYPNKIVPSIHMPKWASRLTLVLTDVRRESLHMISEDDAKAEGARWHDGGETGHSGWRHYPDDGYVWKSCAASFARLWCVIHSPESWQSEPVVTVLEFTVHRCNIKDMPND